MQVLYGSIRRGLCPDLNRPSLPRWNPSGKEPKAPLWAQDKRSWPWTGNQAFTKVAYGRDVLHLTPNCTGCNESACVDAENIYVIYILIF